MDFEAIKSAAEGYKADMTRFLRDMISHPSESCEEKEVVMCIKAEMEKLGFDKVEIDGIDAKTALDEAQATAQAALDEALGK